MKQDPWADHPGEDTESRTSTRLASLTPSIESLPLTIDGLELEAVLESSELLQAAADKIIGGDAASLLDLGFAFAMAVPWLEGCPLIACSKGFTTLSGFTMADTVGLRSEMLLEPLDLRRGDAMRCRWQDFVLAAKEGGFHMLSTAERPEWLPENRPFNELISVQIGVRKDGTLFNSLLMMKIVGIGDFDEEQSYIIALQSELTVEEVDKAVLLRHLDHLDNNMATVASVLGREFIVSGAMRRQEIDSDDEQ